MENISNQELIKCARGCAGDLAGNACVECAFRGSEGGCTDALLLALADRLEALSGQAMPAPTVEGGKEPVKRCATCVYEDRMAEEERCFKCENHSLWEERK